MGQNAPESALSERILFCNIAYMEHYDHILDPSDRPKHGGSYVADTGNAMESWNFHQYDDGQYYGFVETKYTGQTNVEENAKQLHIEKIDASAKGNEIHHVTVVFCAHSDRTKSTVIVGWYKDATVYRKRNKCYDGHSYNITAREAMLLPEILRTKTVPRSRKNGVGFGQSNVWYAKNADSIITDVVNYISKFTSERAIADQVQATIEAMTDEQLQREINAFTEPAETYMATTILRRRNLILPEIAKRRANGICQLCKQPAPFKNKNGHPYLEAHHIIPLADNGADTLDNMVALCPNCHRKMHSLHLPDDVKQLQKCATIH